MHVFICVLCVDVPACTPVCVCVCVCVLDEGTCSHGASVNTDSGARAWGDGAVDRCRVEPRFGLLCAGFMSGGKHLNTCHPASHSNPVAMCCVCVCLLCHVWLCG